MRRTLTVAALLAAGAATAADTRFWRVNTTDLMLKGRGNGVAVTSDGRLQQVVGWQQGAVLDEPVVMAGGRTRDGTLVVGTGHPARLYRVDGQFAELLTEVPGEQITALLAVGKDVLVATAAPGAIYRWRGDRLEELAKLSNGAVWDLVEFGGAVVAAGGVPAALYRLDDRGLERWLELPDAHARCLAIAGDRLLVGTSGEGLILSVDGDGSLALLADSAFTEISDMAVAPDGTVWAAALVGEPVKLPRGRSGDSRDNDKADDTADTVMMDLDLPKIDGSTASSELLRLTPEGALLKVHHFSEQVASAVEWDGDGVLVGTGYEGEVWRFVDRGGSRLAAVDAVQVVAIVDGGAALLTQGPGQVLWRSAGDDPKGRFRINAVGFPRPARLGEYRVTVATGSARIRFRAGVSDRPDDTWLPWTEWLDGDGGVVPLPAVKALQWELELDPGTVVQEVEVALREVNLAPQVSGVLVDAPGVVYLNAPPTSGPVIERSHPDFDGIFTTIDENAKASKNAKGKKYYRIGFRTVSWKARDPNDDPLRFDLEVERKDGFMLPVRRNLKATQLALDTTAVPDGRYRFRLTATDAASNPGGAMEAVASSSWFTVDNTPPEVDLERNGDKWVVSVADNLSPLMSVEWSRDGERWQPMAPDDGVLDGTAESFRFAAQDGRHLIVVQVVDRQHNRATAGAVEE